MIDLYLAMKMAGKELREQYKYDNKTDKEFSMEELHRIEKTIDNAGERYLKERGIV